MGFEPGELLGVHVIAIQNEEADISFFVSVITFAIHVEGFVEALVWIIVIAEAGVERYAGVEQRFVGHLKFLLEIFRFAAAVNIIAEHDYEIVGERYAGVDHLLRGLILGGVAGAHVADYCEADGVLGQRKFKILGGYGGKCRGEDDGTN